MQQHHAAYRYRFTATAIMIIILEVALGAWPVVATVLWGRHAVDTWIHFIWFLRAALLFASVVQNRNAPWRLHYHGTPEDTYTGMLGSCIGATASAEFSLWILASVILHAMTSAIVLLLVAVLKNEFRTTLQWILSLSFNGVAIAESIGSPILLTVVGLGPLYGPAAPELR
jgi:hypothetical protein